MKVITIGREFGSGGREFGRLLAEKLGYAYYDREIITEMTDRSELSEEYIERVIEKNPAKLFPFHHGSTFSLSYDPRYQVTNEVYAKQVEILCSMASRRDCVIVGRCADYILRKMKPLRIFVYADEAHRMARCRANTPENEHLSDRELLKKYAALTRTAASITNISQRKSGAASPHTTFASIPRSAHRTNGQPSLRRSFGKARLTNNKGQAVLTPYASKHSPPKSSRMKTVSSSCCFLAYQTFFSFPRSQSSRL